jgi:hypothetical protein
MERRTYLGVGCRRSFWLSQSILQGRGQEEACQRSSYLAGGSNKFLSPSDIPQLVGICRSTRRGSAAPLATKRQTRGHRPRYGLTCSQTGTALSTALQRPSGQHGDIGPGPCGLILSNGYPRLRIMTPRARWGRNFPSRPRTPGAPGTGGQPCLPLWARVGIRQKTAPRIGVQQQASTSRRSGLRDSELEKLEGRKELFILFCSTHCLCPLCCRRGSLDIVYASQL